MCTKKKAIMPLYFILAMKWRLKGEKKRKEENLFRIHYFCLLIHFLCSAGTGKTCAKMQFGKVLVFVGVSALTGTRK